MNHSDIIEKLSLNGNVLMSLLSGLTEEETHWKPGPEKWSLLEIVCHLCDEEREDFGGRLKHTLEMPEVQMKKIDPVAWVSERKYMEQNFNEKIDEFLEERIKSVAWLKSLEFPKWSNVYHHPKAGELSAEMFLSNWLAHDYLHFRQITFIKYEFLRTHFNTRFDYAGSW
jgi:hypothetical protein